MRTANPLYLKELKEKDLKYFRYYQTPQFRDLEEVDIDDIEDVGHSWGLGDRYYKLAHKYYGDPEMWWIIAWYNGKPTEAHLKIGDVVKVPTPLWKIRAAYGV